VISTSHALSSAKPHSRHRQRPEVSDRSMFLDRPLCMQYHPMMFRANNGCGGFERNAVP
jgi:hypothetical protein